MVEKTIIPGNVHKKIPSDILHRIELIVDVNKAIITNNVFAMRELLPHVEKYEYLTNQIKAALGFEVKLQKNTLQCERIQGFDRTDVPIRCGNFSTSAGINKGCANEKNN